MPNDNKKQPKAETAKRRRIVVSETDSSDECDSPIAVSRRKERIEKLSRDAKKMIKDKDGESEAACSSQNDERVKSFRVYVTKYQSGKKTEQQRNVKISNDSDAELGCTKEDPKSPKTLESPKKDAEDKTAAGIMKSDEKVEKNVNSSDDQCPICWATFASQEVALPSSCLHFFCLQCIIEWSKNTNTCPVDRQSFDYIEVRENYFGKTTKYIPIEAKLQKEPDDEDNFGALSTDSDSIEYDHVISEYESSEHRSDTSFYMSDENIGEIYTSSTDEDQEEESLLIAREDDHEEDNHNDSMIEDFEDEHTNSIYGGEENLRSSFSSSKNEASSPSSEMDSSNTPESFPFSDSDTAESFPFWDPDSPENFPLSGPNTPESHPISGINEASPVVGNPEEQSFSWSCLSSSHSDSKDENSISSVSDTTSSDISFLDHSS